jgi:hypothetical protein
MGEDAAFHQESIELVLDKLGQARCAAVARCARDARVGAAILTLATVRSSKRLA